MKGDDKPAGSEQTPTQTHYILAEGRVSAFHAVNRFRGIPVPNEMQEVAEKVKEEFRRRWPAVAAVENNAAAKAAREAIKVTKERRGYTCHACLEMQAHGDDDARGLRHTKRSGCRFFVVKP